MFDIHTHILPGVDDGAVTLEDSIEIAQAAVKEGIQGLIATPHHHNGRYENEAQSVLGNLEEFRRHLEEKGVPLKIKAGQEIRVYPELVEDLGSRKLLPLGDSPYLLLELPSSRVPSYVPELIYELTLQNIIPILAHPERNMELANDVTKLRQLVEQGALCQITSHSVNGVFGSKIRKVSLYMLRSGLGHFLSSDVHLLTNRGFGMREAAEIIKKDIGEECLLMLQSNASALWGGEIVKNNQTRFDNSDKLSFLRRIFKKV